MGVLFWVVGSVLSLVCLDLLPGGDQPGYQGSDGVIVQPGDTRLDDGINLGLNEADGLTRDFDGGRQGSRGQLHVRSRLLQTKAIQ